MRTSRISQETTRIFNALSPNARQARTTRSTGRAIATFALGYDGSVEVKSEGDDQDQLDGHGSTSTPDIEDVVGTSSPRRSRKRKFGSEPRVDAVAVMSTTIVKRDPTSPTKRSSPRASRIKQEVDLEPELDLEQGQELEYGTSTADSPGCRSKAKPKLPARRARSPGGTVTIRPPSNWEELYGIVKEMRRRNPTAPVDTMGCEDLYWRSAPAKEKRYHTLTALMLSSQTKDTVTAAAMQRLHTELVSRDHDIKSAEITPTTAANASTANETDNDIKASLPPSTLTVKNMLAVDPKHLDSLIGKVGFHNNKTKYIKQTATILEAEYDSDIPSTVEGLIRLPGVGPKMAYLCMSAAWGVDVGIGVDVHVHRITNLWGWHKTRTPEETRAWLEGWLPRDRWHEINKMLVGLGQLTCLPVGRRCGECDLAGTGLCKSEIRGWKPTERRVKREPVKLEVEPDADADVDAKPTI